MVLANLTKDLRRVYLRQILWSAALILTLSQMIGYVLTFWFIVPPPVILVISVLNSCVFGAQLVFYLSPRQHFLSGWQQVRYYVKRMGPFIGILWSARLMIPANVLVTSFEQVMWFLDGFFVLFLICYFGISGRSLFRLI